MLYFQKLNKEWLKTEAIEKQRMESINIKQQVEEDSQNTKIQKKKKRQHKMQNKSVLKWTMRIKMEEEKEEELIRERKEVLTLKGNT